MIPFTKAHACGNDFLIIGEEAVQDYDKVELTQRLCDRNTGIGADGIEYFEWTGDLSGRAHLYNADGSTAEISGNGTRCVAAWMADEVNAQVEDELSVETDAGVRTCIINEFRDSDNGGPTILITTDMYVPEFEPKSVELSRWNGNRRHRYVSMGNPHFVVVLDSSERRRFSCPRTSLGEDVGNEICFHPDFPEQTNVEFVKILRSQAGSSNQIGLRIFERGVGPTSSSGTGTAAAGTAMIGIYGAVSPLDVAAPGGIQTVEWGGAGKPLYLTGPATLIANGEAW